jgi:hypothetical protein
VSSRPRPGTPDQCSAGELPLPSQVKRFGIEPPSRNAGLVTVIALATWGSGSLGLSPPPQPAGSAASSRSVRGRHTAPRYREAVPRRTRILAYGAAAVLTVAGFASAALGGLAGQIAAIALVSAGLGGALLLGFYEVGLSEDRDRAEEEKRRRRR